MDSVSSNLHCQGIGANRNSAPVIDPRDENLFWERGLLGYRPAKVLQHTVFFYIGLNFILRGTQEQYDLIPSQFQRVPADHAVYNETVYYEYTEYISKNNQHRFKDINSSNKSVSAFAQPGNERCIVKLLDAYLTLLPSDASQFYLRALDGSKKPFSKQRVGINTLKNVLPNLLKESGCKSHYTNHSLRATGIIRLLFNSGVPERSLLKGLVIGA